MKFEEFLNESQASDEAKRKGLVSAGWGKWKDKSGKVVAQTVDGKLQPVKSASEDKDTDGGVDYKSEVKALLKDINDNLEEIKGHAGYKELQAIAKKVKSLAMKPSVSEAEYERAYNQTMDHVEKYQT